jgi:hypothetical protein
MKMKDGMNLNGSERRQSDPNGLPDNHYSIKFHYLPMQKYSWMKNTRIISGNI